MRWSLALSLALSSSVVGLTVTSALAEDEMAADNAQRTDAYKAFVDEDGNISRPKGYRKDWSHLGSWFVRKDENASGPGVHDVYANPSAVEGYRETGQWPDGTVLVKEVNGIEEGARTTGHASWAGETGVWFVMIRDRNNRFPDNKAWGGGWGWALFDQNSPEKSLTKTWKGEGFNNCFGCHIPAKKTDWVYIEGYPTIRD